jgi:hypothetical protein
MDSHVLQPQTELHKQSLSIKTIYFGLCTQTNLLYSYSDTCVKFVFWFGHHFCTVLASGNFVSFLNDFERGTCDEIILPAQTQLSAQGKGKKDGMSDFSNKTKAVPTWKVMLAFL